jgi:Pyridoxamine 5'-phosphate oxidase
VDRDTIVFRTDPGSMLTGLLRSPAVCYQVDGIDPADATGWSVLVKGRAVELHNPDELRRVANLPLHYWTLGVKAHWIRIIPDQVTGRRIWSRTTPDASPPTGGKAENPDERAESNEEEVHHGPAPDEQ